MRRKADDGLTGKALAYLKLVPDIWADRRNSGSIIQVTPKGGRYSIYLGEPGTPDITGYLAAPPKVRVVTTAIPFGIETKSLTGKLREAQLRWRDRATYFGVPWCEARTLQDVKDFVAYLRGLQ